MASKGRARDDRIASRVTSASKGKLPVRSVGQQPTAYSSNVTYWHSSKRKHEAAPQGCLRDTYPKTKVKNSRRALLRRTKNTEQGYASVQIKQAVRNKK